MINSADQRGAFKQRALRRFERRLRVIDCHTAGAPARLLIRGCPDVAGASPRARLATFRTEHDHIRAALMCEPRGHAGMYGAVLLKPIGPDADVAALFMHSSGYAYMCGHASMAIGRVAAQSRHIPTRRRDRMRLETPLGVVELRCDRDGQVTFRNIPSFYVRDVEAVLDGLGSVPISIAFGGDFFGLVDMAFATGRRPDLSVAALTRLGAQALDSLRAIDLRHPQFPEITKVNDIMFYGLPPVSGGHTRGLVTWGVDQFDRSPCGSGTSALLAVMHAKHRIEPGRPFVNESVIGTTFTGIIREQTMVGELPAIVAEVTGRPYITGLNNWVIQPDDPFKYGVSSWPEIV